MNYRSHKIVLSEDQLDLLLNIVSTHTEISQQELSDAILHEDTSAVSAAEASLRALDAVMKVLKISR